LFLTVGIIAIFNVGLVDTPFNPRFWLDKPNYGLSEWRYGRIPRDTFKDRWLEQNVPPQVPLAASEYLAAHLTNHRTLCLVRYPDEHRLPQILEGMQYVVADALQDYAFSFSEDLFIGGALHDVPGIRVVIEHPEFELLEAQDGLLLFGRNPGSRRALEQRYALQKWHSQSSPPMSRFEDLIGLLSAQVEPLGERRYRLRYAWVALHPLEQEPPLFAVSRLEGVEHSRIVHLPTQALYPTSSWQLGEVIEEEFDVVLPEELPAGTYRLFTGWYDGSNLFSAATDARSRIGEEVNAGLVVLDQKLSEG
jgi:hypothetical protein